MTTRVLSPAAREERRRLAAPSSVLAKEKTEPLPFVKWAGGKRWLAAQIGKIKPQGWSGRYYEPFVGGGALFFALQPKRATLSDANADLIATYLAIKEDPDAVIETLRTYPFDEEFFYRLRDQNPRRAHKIAARFL